MSLKIVQSCLYELFQRTSKNGSLNNWTKIMAGVPQGSILGLLLFNIGQNLVFNTSYYICS